ncbi:MAG: class I SAM-dependent methyltransferase [Candidatus Helarchaeota archaeon]
MSFEHYFSETPVSDIKTSEFKVFLRNRTYHFITASGVFSQRKIDKGTLILIEKMRLPEKGNVLDLGTGYGAIGIVIADNCPSCKVYMIDINERAIWLAKENVKKNNISNAIVIKSNLFEKIKGKKFNLIISNLPYTTGIKNIEMINQSIPDYLVDNGNYQIVVPKQFTRILSHLETIFKNVEILNKKGYKLAFCVK